MPTEENEIDWKDWMLEIAINYAVPLAGEYLSGLIKQHFSHNQNNMEVMFRNAVEEVCSRIAEIIDQAFLDQYLSDCRHVSNQIRTYGETHDRAIITNVQIESSRLTSRLYDMGLKASGGFFIASNLHLISLRALSEIDETYKRTLEDFTNDYIQMGKELNSKLTAKAEANTPNPVWTDQGRNVYSDPDNPEVQEWKRRWEYITGNQNYPENFIVGSYGLKYPDGHFEPTSIGGFILDIDNELRERQLQYINKARQEIISLRVEPILRIREKTQNVVSNWGNWTFE